MIDAALSRYGAFIGKAVEMNPGAKAHFVGLSSLDWYGNFVNTFGPDADGGNRAFPTLNAALADSNVVASRGDIIYLLPGYTQTIVGAAGTTISKAGLQIVGLGNGSLRPTITFTTAIGAQMVVSGANTLIKNVIFVAGFDAITAMVSVTATDVGFDSCVFRTNSGTVGTVLGVLTAATADRIRFITCRFTGPATNTGTTTTAQIKHEVGVDYVIKDCYFTGKMTQAILNATAVLRGLIDNNRFVVATGTLAINMHASSTPFITNNRMNVAGGTTPVTAAAGFVAGNVYSAAAGVTAGAAVTW